MQFRRIGIENTVEINNPLLSKYCCFENARQFFAAISFIFSEKYTNNTEKESTNKKFNEMILI